VFTISMAMSSYYLVILGKVLIDWHNFTFSFKLFMYCILSVTTV
jgi:hypothetical protein